MGTRSALEGSSMIPLNKTTLVKPSTVIIVLADTMAASATTFSSHGYDIFIAARERLIEALLALDEMVDQTIH